MFGILDLITVKIIESGFEQFKRNPDRLEFLLCGYHADQAMFDYVGAEYIKEAIEFITTNRMSIFPYYQPGNKQSPSIAVIASGNESQQFLGDHGYQIEAPRQTVMSQPKIIAEWTASAIDGNIMTVPPELALDTRLWPGVYITNGRDKVVLDGIVNASTLCLKTDLPANSDPRGWRAETGGSNRIYTINSSMDRVAVQCRLSSHGEPANHRLLGVVLRAILKSSRLKFDQLGFQNTRISYTPIMLTNNDEMEFESVYTIEGDFTEQWVYSEGQSIDPAANNTLSTTAVHSDANKGKVKL